MKNAMMLSGPIEVTGRVKIIYFETRSTRDWVDKC